MSSASDRNLLFGILAWQNGVIGQDQLLEAMKGWTFDKDRPISEVLVSQQAITAEQASRLERMVDDQVALHAGDPRQSLGALSSVAAVSVALGDIDDADVRQSLAMLVSAPSVGADTIRTLGDVQEGQRFQVLRPHAKGGLGEVFVAKDYELNREVALKEIQVRHAFDQRSQARFLLEAEITGGLEHPGIVPIYGLGSYDDGRPYYAMRFIRGETLEDAIEQHYAGAGTPQQKRLSFRSLLKRLIDVCEAIAYAHSRGVLHRDLKPGNIMLGRYGETLVVDWGLAKALSETDTVVDPSLESPIRPLSGSSVPHSVAGTAIGTPGYMSPEQAAGRLDDLGPATDVYAMGATLYHILTGQPSHTGSDIGKILNEVASGNVRPPGQIRSGVPRPLEAICLKAMALKPDDRYVSVSDMAEDLDRYLADEPVTALSEPVWTRAGRWVRKHQVIAAGLAATLLISAIAAGLLQNQAIRRERERTQEQTDRLIAEQKLRAEAETARTAADQSAEKARAAEGVAKTAQADTEVARAATEAALARSDFLLAVSRWESGRAGEAINLLEGIPEEHRHLEWRLARREFCGSDVTWFEPGRTADVRFTARGDKVVASGFSGTRIFDVKTGEKTASFDTDGQAIAFTSDGILLLEQDYTGPFRVLQADGEEVSKLGKLDQVTALALSEDGSFAAVGTEDGVVEIWDARTGEALTRPVRHRDAVTSLCFSQATLVSGDRDGLTQWWDIKTEKVLRHFTDSSSVNCIVVAHDQSRILCGMFNGTIRVWNAKTGVEDLRLGGGQPPVRCIALSADGQFLAAGDTTSQIRVWDLSSGQLAMQIAGHAGGDIKSIAFNPSGDRLVSSGSDGTIRLWDRRLRGPARTCRGNYWGLESVCLSPDGEHLIAASDSTILLYETATGTRLHEFSGHTALVESVRFFPDGRRFVSGGRGGVARIWDARERRVLHELQKDAEQVYSVAVSPSGSLVATAGQDSLIRIWKTDTGQLSRTLTGHTDLVRGLEFADESTIVSLSSDHTVGLWKLDDDASLQTLRSGLEIGADGLAVSPDGQIVAVGDTRHIHLLTIEGRELVTLRNSSDVQCLAFTPDGSRLLSGSEDQCVRVWDPESGVELFALRGHPETIESISISEDGRWLAACSNGNTIRVWDAPRRNEFTNIAVFTGPESKSHSGVSVTPDGRLVAIAQHGQVKIRERGSFGVISTLETPDLSHFTFNRDGSKLYTSHWRMVDTNSGEYYYRAWDTNTGKKLAETEEFPGRDYRTSPDNVSDDGRWQVHIMAGRVQLVDRTVTTQDSEVRYRQMKSRGDWYWHQHIAFEAEDREDWHLATWHYAWAFEARPTPREHYRLHVAAAKLARSPSADRTPGDFVTEVLARPQPELTKDSADAVASDVWNRVVNLPKGAAVLPVETSTLEWLCADEPSAAQQHTLGLIRYRLGEYAAAVEALEAASGTLYEEVGLPAPPPSEIGFLAMSYLQLGNQAEADRCRARLAETMKLDAFKDHDISLKIVAEVDALFAEKQKAPDEP